MFIKVLKVFLSLMALAIIILVFLVVTGTCQLEFHPKKKNAISADMAAWRPSIGPIIVAKVKLHD